MAKEIEIPEGYEARIEGNKVIFVPKESEDEKIRKELLEEIEFIIPHDDETDSEGLILPSYHARIDRYKSYLEKQKEQNQTRDNALQKAFINSKIDYTLEEKCDASDYAETILPTSVTYGEGKEEYKLHKIIEAAFIAGQKKEKNPTDRAFTFDDVLALESAMALAKDDKKLHGTLKSIFERVYDAYHGEQEPRRVEREREKERRIVELKTFIAQCNGFNKANQQKAFNMIDALCPYWKPSDEQMKALSTAYRLGKLGKTDMESLQSLYEQLKKL